jgi:hypothetical protein
MNHAQKLPGMVCETLDEREVLDYSFLSCRRAQGCSPLLEPGFLVSTLLFRIVQLHF